jgi:hypothetical protein
MSKTKYTIGDFSGEWTIKNSWVSDLGLIMIAFWNEEKKLTMNVNTGTTLEQALKLPWAQDPKDYPPPTVPPDKLTDLY